MIKRSFSTNCSVWILCSLPCTKYTPHPHSSLKTAPGIYVRLYSGPAVRVCSHGPFFFFFFHLLLLSKQSVRAVSDTSCNPCRRLEWTPRRIDAPLVSTTRRFMYSSRLRCRGRTLRRGKEYLVHAYQNMNSSISLRTALWLGTAKHKIQVIQYRVALTGRMCPDMENVSPFLRDMDTFKAR